MGSRIPGRPISTPSPLASGSLDEASFYDRGGLLERNTSSVLLRSSGPTPAKARAEGDIEKVKVYARIRPALREDETPGALVWSEENGLLTIFRPDAPVPHSDFVFDKVLGPTASQADVYAVAVSDVVADVLRGYNGTILAYGQTGAGKTYTIGNTAPDAIGMIPRAAAELFSAASRDAAHTYSITMSYIQIYMEMIQDLLNPTADNLPIREDANGVFVSGACEVPVTSLEECLHYLELGEQNRVFAFTHLNAHSSRSHAVVMLTAIKSRKYLTNEERAQAEAPDQDGVVTQKVTVGKLYMVDLAGSERLKKSKSVGLRATEARSINLSLTMLGMCISARAQDSPHVPFRDSKLTRLLQESLGGNAKTSLILCLSDVRQHADESLQSLQFGARAACVRNKPVVNERLQMRQLTAELLAALEEGHERADGLEAALSQTKEERDALQAALARERARSAAIVEALREEARERDEQAAAKLAQQAELLSEHVQQLGQVQQQQGQLEMENARLKQEAASREEAHRAEMAELHQRMAALTAATAAEKAALQAEARSQQAQLAAAAQKHAAALTARLAAERAAARDQAASIHLALTRLQRALGELVAGPVALEEVNPLVLPQRSTGGGAATAADGVRPQWMAGLAAAAAAAVASRRAGSTGSGVSGGGAGGGGCIESCGGSAVQLIQEALGLTAGADGEANGFTLSGDGHCGAAATGSTDDVANGGAGVGAVAFVDARGNPYQGTAEKSATSSFRRGSGGIGTYDATPHSSSSFGSCGGGGRGSDSWRSQASNPTQHLMSPPAGIAAADANAKSGPLVCTLPSSSPSPPPSSVASRQGPLPATGAAMETDLSDIDAALAAAREDLLAELGGSVRAVQIVQQSGRLSPSVLALTVAAKPEVCGSRDASAGGGAGGSSRDELLTAHSPLQQASGPRSAPSTNTVTSATASIAGHESNSGGGSVGRGIFGAAPSAAAALHAASQALPGTPKMMQPHWMAAGGCGGPDAHPLDDADDLVSVVSSAPRPTGATTAPSHPAHHPNPSALRTTVEGDSQEGGGGSGGSGGGGSGEREATSRLRMADLHLHTQLLADEASGESLGIPCCAPPLTVSSSSSGGGSYGNSRDDAALASPFSDAGGRGVATAATAGSVAVVAAGAAPTCQSDISAVYSAGVLNLNPAFDVIDSEGLKPEEYDSTQMHVAAALGLKGLTSSGGGALPVSAPPSSVTMSGPTAYLHALHLQLSGPGIPAVGANGISDGGASDAVRSTTAQPSPEGSLTMLLPPPTAIQMQAAAASVAAAGAHAAVATAPAAATGAAGPRQSALYAGIQVQLNSLLDMTAVLRRIKAGLERRLAQQAGELAQRAEQHQQLQEAGRHTDGQLQATRGALRSSEAQLAITNAELQSVRHTLDHTVQELDRTRDALEERTADLEQMSAVLDETAGRLEDTVRQLDDTRCGLEASREKGRRLETELERMQVELELERSTLASMLAASARSQAQSTQALAARHELQRQIRAANTIKRAFKRYKVAQLKCQVEAKKQALVDAEMSLREREASQMARAGQALVQESVSVIKDAVGSILAAFVSRRYELEARKALDERLRKMLPPPPAGSTPAHPAPSMANSMDSYPTHGAAPTGTRQAHPPAAAAATRSATTPSMALTAAVMLRSRTAAAATATLSGQPYVHPHFNQQPSILRGNRMALAPMSLSMMLAAATLPVGSPSGSKAASRAGTFAGAPSTSISLISAGGGHFGGMSPAAAAPAASVAGSTSVCGARRGSGQRGYDGGAYDDGDEVTSARTAPTVASATSPRDA